MNAERRKKIEKIVGQLSELRAELEPLRDEEQEARDNMPESFQNGERGEKAQECIDALDNACTEIENIESALTDAVSA